MQGLGRTYDPTKNPPARTGQVERRMGKYGEEMFVFGVVESKATTRGFGATYDKYTGKVNARGGTAAATKRRWKKALAVMCLTACSIGKGTWFQCGGVLLTAYKTSTSHAKYTEFIFASLSTTITGFWLRPIASGAAIASQRARGYFEESGAVAKGYRKVVLYPYGF